MNLDQRVYLSLRDYSSIFPNRAEVLHHMYFIIGNGFEWHEGRLCSPWMIKRDGELVKCFDEGKLPKRLVISPKRIYKKIVKRWETHFKDENNHYAAKLINSFQKVPCPDEALFLEIHKKKLIESSWKEWQERSSKNTLWRPYPFYESHSRISSVPNEVTTDYLVGAFEAIEDYLNFDPKNGSILHGRLGVVSNEDLSEFYRNRELVRGIKVKLQHRFNLDKRLKSL